MSLKNERQVEQTILKIQMLGRFTMTYETIPVSLNKVNSAKSVRLLQMLLLSGKNGIAKSELIDSLYGWNNSNDGGSRNHSLNSLIYRLQKQLIMSGLPEDKYVVLQNNRCYWGSSIKVELDASRFESLVMAARAADGMERIRLYQQANECYYGELLPANLTEIWFYNKSIYYKELYLETVQVLGQEWKKLQDYKNLLAMYERIAAIYPFENWQSELIRCNLEMYRYDEALEIYNQTMELYSKEMGNPPTHELQKCFEQLVIKDKPHSYSLKSEKDWRMMDKVFMGRKSDIAKAIFQNDVIPGAYYCTYPSFVDYCRLVARAKRRHEFSSILMFLTLTQYEKKRNTTSDKVLEQQMEILKHSIRTSLRSGDAFTRYGNRHYILMLTNIERESCSIVFERIEAAYNRMPNSKGEIWYHTAMTQELEANI